MSSSRRLWTGRQVQFITGWWARMSSAPCSDASAATSSVTSKATRTRRTSLPPSPMSRPTLSQL